MDTGLVILSVIIVLFAAAVIATVIQKRPKPIEELERTVDADDGDGNPATAVAVGFVQSKRNGRWMKIFLVKRNGVQMWTAMHSDGWIEDLMDLPIPSLDATIAPDSTMAELTWEKRR